MALRKEMKHKSKVLVHAFIVFLLSHPMLSITLDCISKYFTE